jgi:hypothetical protein
MVAPGRDNLPPPRLVALVSQRHYFRSEPQRKPEDTIISPLRAVSSIIIIIMVRVRDRQRRMSISTNSTVVFSRANEPADASSFLTENRTSSILDGTSPPNTTTTTTLPCHNKQQITGPGRTTKNILPGDGGGRNGKILPRSRSGPYHYTQHGSSTIGSDGQYVPWTYFCNW